jgi:outer membrane biosynthesis protein TonB
MSEAKENKKGKRNGLVTTLLIHACLLILCLFLGFTNMTPPKGDVSIGFEALGTENAGSTDDLATSETLSDTPEEVQETPQQSQDNPVEEDYSTQKDSPVEVTKNTNTTEQNNSENTKQTKSTKTTKKPREVDESLKNLGGLLQGPNNPGGKGEGGEEGNEGTKKGVPTEEGKGGNGKDGMFDFGGRKAVSPGNLKHDCGVRATADVRVTVDRSGYVINAVMVGGTNFNDCIEKKAIAAAKGTKYSSNPDGPKFQEGTISLSFHVN